MIIDVLDATEASDRHEAAAIRAGGSRPIILHGMCGAVEHVVQEIIARAGTRRRITLLRFHGHGAPGMMNIAAGKAAHFQHHSGVSVGNLGATSGSLAKLTPFFASRARVELHGCKVAKGPNGQKLLKDLATIWGVPVSAGTRNQIGGTGKQFKFEGPVHTAMPGGGMLCGLPY